MDVHSVICSIGPLKDGYTSFERQKDHQRQTASVSCDRLNKTSNTGDHSLALHCLHRRTTSGRIWLGTRGIIEQANQFKHALPKGAVELLSIRKE